MEGAGGNRQGLPKACGDILSSRVWAEELEHLGVVGPGRAGGGRVGEEGSAGEGTDAGGWG